LRWLLGWCLFFDLFEQLPVSIALDKFFQNQARALFIQVINHGIEHRTNITTILSSLGLPAPEVDGWGYLWAHPDQFEMKEGSQ
jgi:uncharacterized damage-inducible protein DinB